LLKSVKIDVFRVFLNRFYPVFEQKSVKIQGLKSFVRWITPAIVKVLNLDSNFLILLPAPTSPLMPGFDVRGFIKII